MLLILSWNSFGEQTAEELSKILLDDFEQRAIASTLVPETIRSAVIEYVRKVRDRKIYGNGTSAEILLVNLNDQEYIQQLFADFLQSENPMACRRASDTLGRSSQVEVIPMFAEYLNEGDDNIIYRDDKFREIMLVNYSISGGSISMQILSRSPDVPADVREWAQATLLEKKNGLERREVIRQWWPENKQHFETKEYHKLRPLNSANAGEEIKNTVNTASLSVVQTSTNRVLPSEGLENSPVPANSSPQSSNPWKLLFPILGIVVLILAVLFSKQWKRR